MAKKLFLLTTEASGDLLGAGLLDALEEKVADLTVAGVGGDRLIARGMDCIYHVRDFSVMGLFEVLSRLKELQLKFNQLVARVEEMRPDAIVLVDAPDFNIRFAKAVRKLGIPIIYYVSPQVWAWRKKRAKQIAKLVDHMMVLFSFEVAIYEALGLPTTWVGHPLVDELAVERDRDAFFDEHGLDRNKPLVALAPGSRNSEVKRILPTLCDLVGLRADRYQFAMPLAPTVDRDVVEAIIAHIPIRLMPGLMRPLIAHADAAVVASGTATLETALLGTPQIVGYRLKTSSYWLARTLVNVPNIALVNIVLNKRVVPELVQGAFSAENVAPLLDQMIGDPAKRQEILAEYARLDHILGGGGADKRAADVIGGFLKA